MASNFMSVEGHCIGCGRKGPLANRQEPFCVSCYARIVIPIPLCRQPKPASQEGGRWRLRKGCPRRGKVRFLTKVIEDDQPWGDNL